VSTIFGRRFRLDLAATSALVATAAFASPAFAQSHAFNVAAQPAQRGIAEFARQADIQILVSEETAHGRRTNAVRGDFDAATGLNLLLSGTGLQAKATSASTFTVVSAEAPAQGAAAVDTTTSVGTVIVTGRVGSTKRTRADTSYSISVIPQERIRETGASSVADSLRNIPGFWVENSGGEASANIRARGIPVDGYSSVQLEEDGMPIQHDPGLGYLNVDQSFRLDETVSQIQVVRGGPSSVFAPNAPGGVINYITRKPTDEAQGLAKLTLGDDGLYRGDFWYGGPIGDWKVAGGGFFRVERGTRDPGYNFNDGGQYRLQASRTVGNGVLEFDYKHIDDKVGFYLPIPIAAGGGGVTSVPGFNASTGILNGPATERLNLLTDHGRFDLNISDGTDVKLDQFSAHLTQDVAGWKMDNHFRMRSTDQQRIGLYTGSVQTGATRLSQLLPAVQTLFPAAASVEFTYVRSPATVFSPTQNGNGLEVDNNAREVSLTEREVMNDLRFSRQFNAFGLHDVSIGGYVMSAHETFNRYSAVLAMDVKTHADLLNVVALDAGGNVLGTASDNGVLRYGSEFADGQGDQLTLAGYFADEWQVTDRLRIDAGVRYEQMHTDGASQGTKAVNLGVTHTLADTNYLTGNGIWTPYDRTFHTVTWTLGADWQLDKAQGVFARVTQAARMPSISDFITNAANQPVINHTDLFEAGYKLSRPFGDLYLTLFDTEYHNYGVSENVYSNVTNTYITQNYFANTRDYGLEFDGVVRPVHWFDLAFAGTVQNPTFTSLKYTVLSGGSLQTINYNGNQLLRIPKNSFSFSPTLHLLDDRLMGQVTVEYYSDRFADAANSQLLPAYTVVNTSVRYNISPSLTFHLSGYNLTNAIGLTEGNPRAGEVQSSEAGQPVFLARPIVGRTFRASLLYRF
jgi:outer membrane receptor protein involved in Fe transport